MDATLFDIDRDARAAPPFEAEPAAVSLPVRRRVILGVDPGASGAVAFFDPAQPHLIDAHDAPVVGSEIDVATLVRLIRSAGATEAIIEQVSAMPKQGVSSTFKFGMAYGAVRAAAAALELPTRLVTPGRWKKHFRLSAAKEQARALAIRTWPGSPVFSRKKDHGRAEASLLALFGSEVLR